jgi:hypothetical protein
MYVLISTCTHAMRTYLYLHLCDVYLYYVHLRHCLMLGIAAKQRPKTISCVVEHGTVVRARQNRLLGRVAISEI